MNRCVNFHMPYIIEPLSNQHCHTGENPYWNPSDHCIYWTDIPAGVLYRYDPSNQRTEAVYHGAQVGGFTLQADGNFLLFRETDMATFDPRSRRVESIIHYTDDTMERFNDVHADPVGRVYAGTIAKNRKPVGSLYCIDLDGSVRKVATGSAVGNGLAFTLDEKFLYWTCSSRRKIFRYEWDRRSGDLRNEIVFYDAPEDEGIPDGMAMDKHGNLWSCRWDGHRIVVIDPGAKVIDTIWFEVAKVSCAFFGGKDSNELFVSTSGGNEGSATADGTLYRIVTQTRGRPRFVSRIGLS